MNSKIFFLGAIMLLPTFASCQQEKPFPDDAVDKVYEYLPEWQAGYWIFIRLVPEEVMQPILFFRMGLPCYWMQEI